MAKGLNEAHGNRRVFECWAPVCCQGLPTQVPGPIRKKARVHAESKSGSVNLVNELFNSNRAGVFTEKHTSCSRRGESPRRRISNQSSQEINPRITVYDHI